MQGYNRSSRTFRPVLLTASCSHKGLGSFKERIFLLISGVLDREGRGLAHMEP